MPRRARRAALEPTEGRATPLKAAFARARETRDMAGVLPVLLRSDLFVVAHAEGEALSLFIRGSPQPGRMCVTIAESREALAGVPPHLVHAMTPGRLLAGMIGAWDIVVCYPDGGDLLQAECLPDLRAMLGREGA